MTSFWIVLTYRDDSCALKRDRVAVQLNDDSVHTRVWRPGLTLRRLYVHLEAVQFRAETGACQQVGTLALEVYGCTVKCPVMRIADCTAAFSGCETKCKHVGSLCIIPSRQTHIYMRYAVSN